MKANYSRDDLYEIAKGELLLTEEESRLLRERLCTRRVPGVLAQAKGLLAETADRYEPR
jgi:hypothetical protein